jgi:hypothetical protein
MLRSQPCRVDSLLDFRQHGIPDLTASRRWRRGAARRHQKAATIVRISLIGSGTALLLWTVLTVHWMPRPTDKDLR